MLQGCCGQGIVIQYTVGEGVQYFFDYGGKAAVLCQVREHF